MPDARTRAADLAERVEPDVRSAEKPAIGGEAWNRVPPPVRVRPEAQLEFRVVQDRPTAEAFQAQLIACYARYGASAAATTPPVTDVAYLVVEIERHMVAGIRLHRRGANRLPLESYFAH